MSQAAQESQDAQYSRMRAVSDGIPTGFLSSIGERWAEPEPRLTPTSDTAGYAAKRREQLSAEFPGMRLVIPAGDFKTRNGDSEFPFRAHAAFLHLTGWGSHSEAESILVLEPERQGHTPVLYARDRASRASVESYADPRVSEFWVGQRPELEVISAQLNIATAPLANFREQAGDLWVDVDNDLTRAVSQLRLVKDEYEISELRSAIDATALGFDDMLRDLPRLVGAPRGERALEGAFRRRARIEGNGEGYETVVAAGSHACHLHWTRNDGAVEDGDLVLIDAGVEVDSMYTADITRTIPASGKFTDVQRRIYEIVLEAADAAIAAALPGERLRVVQDAAVRVLAMRLGEWGLLPVPVEEALDELKGGQHRRYMVHGISHHLGLDLHDCADAGRANYSDGTLVPGMIFTVEPGLYFHLDDLSVPADLRGIGVRIEDDILITKDGPVNLSKHIPRAVQDVERWTTDTTYRLRDFVDA